MALSPPAAFDTLMKTLVLRRPQWRSSFGGGTVPKTRAAVMLGITPDTLRYKMKKFDLH